MDPRLQAPPDPPSAERLTSQARGLFAAGWYATRDECRLVHPVERTEQLVSPETWRALRRLAARVPVKVAVQEPG